MKYVTKQLKTIPLVILCFLGVSFATQAEDGHLFIDGIDCDGNTKTDCEFIRQRFYQDVGDILDPDEVTDAKLRLSSLQLFRDVSVRLEKSSVRGHVIVVFDVIEANAIQQQLLVNYVNVQDDYWSEDVNVLRGTYSITDFNAFGSNKQLSLSARASIARGERSQLTASFDNLRGWEFDREIKTISAQNHEFVLNYHDPNLLGSNNYFLNARASYDNGDSNQEGGLSVGRRFASFSYFSLGYAQNLEEKGLTFSYGWDSRDDFLFPTEGSQFEISRKSIDEVFMGYTKYHSYNDENLFSWGIGVNSERDAFGVNAKYTFLSERNEVEGKFSGWSVFANKGVTDYTDDQLGLEYTRVNNDFIVNFRLSLERGDR